MPQTLLDIAKQYKSVAAFKLGNLPKYLIARRKGLLNKAFPKDKNAVKSIKGIYFLYRDTKIVYIAHSVVDVKSAIESQRDRLDFNNYKYYQLDSEADIIVLSLFLANKYKPRFNTNISTNLLSVNVSNLNTLLGKSIKDVT